MKPGYKTSEFWLTLAALLLTALYSSGVIPTSGTFATIAAIVVTMLGSLGHAVTRTLLKAGAPSILAFCLIIGVSQSGCAATKHDVSAVKDGVVRCVKSDLPAIEAFALQLGSTLLIGTFAESPDWAALWRKTSEAAQAGIKLHGLAIATCAFDLLVTSLENQPPSTPLRALSASEAPSTARTDPIGIGLMELENFRTINHIQEINQ